MLLASPIASDASRPTAADVLTPSRPGSLNRGHALPDSPHGVKRKRYELTAMDHLLKPSISLRPHPPRLNVQPYALQPMMLLPRQCVPLSALDLFAPWGDLPKNRLFQSRVKILDLESRMPSCPTVLLARSETTGAVYVVERQEDGLFVVCKLANWADLSAMAAKASALLPERLRERSPQQAPQVPLITPLASKKEKSKTAAIEAIQFLVKKRARSPSGASSKPATTQPLDSAAQATAQGISSDPQPVPSTRDQAVQEPEGKKLPLAHELGQAVPQQSTDMILDNIRTQYVDLLYKSKGSLAYFAKGPLSRARSTFSLDVALNIADLTDFLKSLILTTAQIDKKYRDTIPDFILKMRSNVESSDEAQRKRRRVKKMRPGKDGLYPLEDESIRAWWLANIPEPKDGNCGVLASQIRSHVSILRTRETQLQMILILETLALESLITGESTLPPLPGTSETQGQTPLPSKKRNKHNLPVLVDVHADRLTIWQSTASDEQLLLEDSQHLHRPFGEKTQLKSSSEPLKDFCVDIIVPFFSARLPGICHSINGKLGGPVAASPPISKAPKRGFGKREQKPGAATSRPGPSNVPRTLQRALSTEQQNRRSVSRGPGNKIALMRSATSTSLSGIKKEASESVVLSAVPQAEPDAPRSVSSQTQSNRSTTTPPMADAKADKRAQLASELKAAISALRKPNREVVSKAMAEAAERRATTPSSTKKAKRPARNGSASHVQVKATPTKNRFQTALPVPGATPGCIASSSIDGTIPLSNPRTHIPSTASRNSTRDTLCAESPLAATPLRRVEEPSFLRRTAGFEAVMHPSSPLLSTSTKDVAERWSETPVKANAGRSRVANGCEIDEGLAETPVVRRTVPWNAGERTVLEKAPKELSIYEKLGWDDEYE